jgi:hypothetical protein
VTSVGKLAGSQARKRTSLKSEQVGKAKNYLPSLDGRGPEGRVTEGSSPPPSLPVKGEEVMFLSFAFKGEEVAWVFH